MTTLWFDADSLTSGAAVAGRVLDLDPAAAVDVRGTGVRVRVADELAETVQTALGLDPDPTAVQEVSVVVETADPTALSAWWTRVLGYEAAGHDLVDPLRRDPTVRIRRSQEPRPLRHRIHLDVVRPAPVVEGLGLKNGGGPWGVRHADADGNEVDLVPGDPLDGTEDWQSVFSAIACYRVTSIAQQRGLATAAAGLAHASGFPLLVDLRPGLVVLDSGKDRSDADAHGLDLDFSDLARDLQAAARELGAIADPAAPRFVQLFLDAADVAAVRAFWTGTLGYVADRRTHLSDVVDPRGLNPVLVFQQLDTTDDARRRQRNRMHVELDVPVDQVPAHVDGALAAGGRLLEDGRVADPEGNELWVVGR